MSPVFFENQAEFRKWLKANHKKETELIVGFYKKDSGKFNMSWSDAVDEALCFGWIDSTRRSIDEISYCNRFTPRKKSSNWSAINIAKVEELMKAGKMMPAGLEAFSFRKEEKSKVYSFENDTIELSPFLEREFKKHKAARDFFLKQAPSYQRIVVHWIMSAKKEETRFGRLEKMIKYSEEGKRISFM
ncbi:MAG: YdeI/OmpD-associated family protein [Candidatus Kapaibacterium sp.]